MTDRTHVDARLKELGIKTKGWGSAEINELPSILMPQETIMAVAQGWYEGGFASLVATDERLLLIDKRTFNLTIEDVRYEMIAEVDYNARLFDAGVNINTVNKSLRFTCMKPGRLRQLTNYVQQRMMEIRQGQFTWQQFEQTPLPDHRTLQERLMPAPEAVTAPTGVPTQMPLVSPDAQLLKRLPQNNFAKMSLTTKHNFLPKIPARFRPD